jgi:pimeloyl-ACP methyl ester carboxylesterase
VLAARFSGAVYFRAADRGKEATMLGWLQILALISGNYELNDVVASSPANAVSRVEYRISASASSLDEFSITHVQRKAGCLQTKPPVILLSPFLLPGSFYEISDSGDYLNSAAGKLAMDGYDVWLVDQRRSKLAPGACEQGTADCGVMANWDFNTLSDDGLLTLAFVRALHPNKKPVVGGFSAGANAAIAVVNRAPNEVAGAFLYEGSFYTEDATIRAHNQPICESLETALNAGQYYDSSAQMYSLVLHLAATDPDGLSPIPAFPPGTTNQLAMLYVFSSPPPAGALSPTPGFVRCLADFSSQSFLYTDPSRLFQLGAKFDNYASLAPMRDLACGLAGSDTTHVDNLAAFRGDLLVFVEGSGFGPAMFDMASLFTSARQVTIEHHPEYGEADPYFHYDWQQVFYQPFKNWLDTVQR